jgi:CYTH domain-containing protein
MGIEIEKKFLVTGDAWRKLGPEARYCQGYLNRAAERTVRVRTVDGKGFLTIKGRVKGSTRLEYEYEIPIHECREILECLAEKPLIEKSRYTIEHKGLIWEVDEFYGENQGLVVAEVELDSEDQIIELPDWIGTEVTEDSRYFNSNLIRHPYQRWQK